MHMNAFHIDVYEWRKEHHEKKCGSSARAIYGFRWEDKYEGVGVLTHMSGVMSHTCAHRGGRTHVRTEEAMWLAIWVLLPTNESCQP